MNATLLVSSCVGNIIGPLTFTARSAPDYIPAKITIVLANSVSIGLACALVLYYLWENRRRDKLNRTQKVHQKDVELADITDRKNLEFRYRI